MIVLNYVGSLTIYIRALLITCNLGIRIQILYHPYFIVFVKFPIGKYLMGAGKVRLTTSTTT